MYFFNQTIKFIKLVGLSFSLSKCSLATAEVPPEVQEPLIGNNWTRQFNIINVMHGPCGSHNLHCQ